MRQKVIRILRALGLLGPAKTVYALLVRKNIITPPLREDRLESYVVMQEINAALDAKNAAQSIIYLDTK